MRFVTSVSPLCGLALLSFSAIAAHAQAIYVTSDRTINSDESGKDVFVGKDPITFTTLATPVTLTIDPGATLTSSRNGTLVNGNDYGGVNVFGTHRVNLNGGHAETISAFEGSTVNVSGGDVGSLFAYDETHINVHGGGVTTTLLGVSTSTVNIDGGVITARPTILMSATMNLSGSNFNVVQGAEYWNYDGYNQTESRIRDYTITGLLSDGNPFSQTVTAAADSHTISSTNVQLRGWSVDEVAPNHAALANESINSLWSNVYVGRDPANPGGNTSPTVTFNTGTQVGVSVLYNNSQATFADGRVDNSIYTLDNSVLNVTGGSVNAVQTIGSASQANITGGTLAEVATYAGTANINGGTVSYAVGFDQGTTNINAGSVQTVTGIGNSVVNVHGGQIGDVNGDGNAVFTIDGGRIVGPISLVNNSVVNILGNNLSSAFAGRFAAGDTFYNLYLLGGTLLDGTSIDGLAFVDYDGGLSIGNPFQGAQNTGNLRFFGTFAAVAPEPGSLLLLGAGLMPLTARLLRRRAAKS